MRHWTTLSILVILAVVTAPVGAVSNPVIAGAISGVELCPQEICGEAVFAGSFIGSVGGKATNGVFWTGITHTALPTAINGTADITGGTWLIRTRTHTFAGVVQATPGGITYLGGNLFAITLTESLVVTIGGTGTLTFAGTLSHAVFPPTIIGVVSQ